MESVGKKRLRRRWGAVCRAASVTSWLVAWSMGSVPVQQRLLGDAEFAQDAFDGPRHLMRRFLGCVSYRDCIGSTRAHELR
jgi:hypothetical protein